MTTTKRMQLRTALAIFLCHGIVLVAHSISKLVRVVRRKDFGYKKVSVSSELRTLVVSAPYVSGRWLATYLDPIEQAFPGIRIIVVANPLHPLPEIFETVTPSSRLTTAIGADLARAVMLFSAAIRNRADVILGLHLELHGLLCLIVGRLTNASTWYFNIGGIAEIAGGGVAGGQRLFQMASVPSRKLEQRLLGVISEFDIVLSMGSSTRRYFEAAGITRPIFDVGVGVGVGDDCRCSALSRHSMATYDVICVARLEPVKRIDRLLRVVRATQQEIPRISVAIVGDGSCRGSLVQLVADLALEDCVEFVGWTEGVYDFLVKSKVFMLTSASEGLSIAAIEAAQYGLPCIVPAVGDLGDLVRDDHNGWLIDPDDVLDISAKLASILRDQDLYLRLSEAARTAGNRFTIAECANRWVRALE